MSKIGSIARWVVLGAFTAFTLVPLIWLIVSSFKTNNELFSDPFGLPNTWSFGNYIEALIERPMFIYLKNSLVTVLLSTGLILGASLLAAYALMYRFRMSKTVFGYLLFGVLLPVNALMTPIFFIIHQMKLYNTTLGLSLVYAGIFFPLGFLIIKAYMDTTPREILEAARVDGASFHAVFARIVAPLSMPGIITAGIFLMISVFNELLFATILTSDLAAQTVQVGVRYFLATYSADYPLAFAATVISIAPTVVVYMLLSDRIVVAMTAGSLK